MAKKKRPKKGATLVAVETVKRAVTTAAKATVKAAEEYVVEPVKKVLAPAPKKTAAPRKRAAKKAVASPKTGASPEVETATVGDTTAVVFQAPEATPAPRKRAAKKTATAPAADAPTPGEASTTTLQHDLGSIDVYVEPSLRKPLLVVFAATPVAATLVHWAPAVGFDTVVVEPRTERLGSGNAWGRVESTIEDIAKRAGGGGSARAESTSATAPTSGVTSGPEGKVAGSGLGRSYTTRAGDKALPSEQI